MAIAEGPDGCINSVFRSFPFSRASILERWPKAKEIEGFEAEKICPLEPRTRIGMQSLDDEPLRQPPLAAVKG